MTAIVLANRGMVDEITELAHRIDEATAQEAASAYDRLGMAREWAKMQEDAAELAARLVWLEAVILRRIGQLDLRVLSSARRAAARHFATLDDATLSELLEAFPARSAVSAYNLWARAEGIRKTYHRGRGIVTGSRHRRVDEDGELPPTLRDAIGERVLTVRQAAAVIVDEYGGDVATTVARVVDQFIGDYAPIPLDASALEATAFRRGLTAAVREAFASAPVDGTDGAGIVPAYITTYSEDTGEWVRVPSEFATVGDARQMVALRRGQLESFRRSVDELCSWMQTLYDIDSRPAGDFLRDDQVARQTRERATGITLERDRSVAEQMSAIAEARLLSLGDL